MSEKETLHFYQMGLDDRLLKAITKLGWATPTPIQETAIPLALEGRDVLARAKTGSGKTAVYAVPVVQRILEWKLRDSSPAVRAMVLVPTKELSKQAARNIKDLCSSCSREVSLLNVSAVADITSVKTVLLEKPDIVVGTPSRILAHFLSQTLRVRQSLEMLVLDEADLLFSFGYEEDINTLVNRFLPSVCQTFLLSATLSEHVMALKKLVLHNPVTLKLEEPDLPEEDRLTQYYIGCSSEDKFLLIYTLLKLKLVRGKTLMFVNEINHCYKLKLFLEQFSIKSCVLNAELPQNSRCHLVEDFNRGLYDYVIATDEAPVMQAEGKLTREAKQDRKRKRRPKDTEYGVARGIDFHGVENVINFDFPPSIDAYTHRVGRTARGYSCGTALTFVTPEEEESLTTLEQQLRKQRGDTGIDGKGVVRPYQFKMSEINGFRYRVTDALRAVTGVAIREARLKEIRVEMLTSEKLKSHFEDNPRDLQVLRHDSVLHPDKVQPHLKDIPSYLVPKAIQESAIEVEKSRTAATRHRGHGYIKSKHRRNDPLRSFSIAKGRVTKGSRN